MAMMFCCGGPRIPAMMPESPMRELREYVSGFENAFSLSLRFGLQSMGKVFRTVLLFSTVIR